MALEVSRNYRATQKFCKRFFFSWKLTWFLVAVICWQESKGCKFFSIVMQNLLSAVYIYQAPTNFVDMYYELVKFSRQHEKNLGWQTPCIRKPNHSSQSSQLLVCPLIEISRKDFQGFAPTPYTSSPTQSCLISMRVVASRVNAKLHHTLFIFFLISTNSFLHASFCTCGFSSHPCLLQWPVVQAYWFALESPVETCRAPSCLHLLQQAKYSRLESPSLSCVFNYVRKICYSRVENSKLNNTLEIRDLHERSDEQTNKLIYVLEEKNVRTLFVYIPSINEKNQDRN